MVRPGPMAWGGRSEDARAALAGRWHAGAPCPPSLHGSCRSASIGRPVPAGAERDIGRAGGCREIEHGPVWLLRTRERSDVVRGMDRPRIRAEQRRDGDGGSPWRATDRLLPRALCPLLILSPRPSPSRDPPVPADSDEP